MYISPNAKQQFTDRFGKPLVGGKLHTYYAGSFTNAPTYDESGSTNANPIILDSRGEAVVMLDNLIMYKYVLKDKDDNEIWTRDDVTGLVITSGGSVETNQVGVTSADTTPGFLNDKITATSG